MSLAAMSRIGRYLLYEEAALACIWPLRAVLAVTCRVVWLFWPVSLAVMSRIGRYLLCEEAVLARVAGRHEPRWAVFAVCNGCPGPCRWSFSAVPGRSRLPLGGHACLCGLPEPLVPCEHLAHIWLPPDAGRRR